MMDGFGTHGWGMGWGWIIGIIVLIGIIWFIAKTLNRTKKRTQNTGKTPLEILKERYARGEIDKDDFEQRKKDIV